MKPTLADKHLFAAVLRENQTAAELRLWECLRAEQLGYRFSRQRTVQGFIVDFWCGGAIRLAVELDGFVHSLPQKQDRDRQLEDAFAARGIGLIRFSNDDVFARLDMVCESIRLACSRRRAERAKPPYSGFIAPNTYRSSSRPCASLQISDNFLISRTSQLEALVETKSSTSGKQRITEEEFAAFCRQLVEVSRQKCFDFDGSKPPVSEKAAIERERLRRYLNERQSA